MMELFKYSDTHTIYNKYYTVQSGSGLHVYRGRTVVPQTGEGIASVLMSIANNALPYAKTVEGRLLTEAGNLVGDLLSGENFAETAKKRLMAADRGISVDFSFNKKRKAPTQTPRRKTNGRRSVSKKRKPQRGRRADVFD